MKKILIIFMAIIIVLTPIKASATSLPVPGVNTDLVSLGEFASWVMLLFGVHDNNANSNDIYFDTDFIDMLNNEAWRTKVLNTVNEGKTPKQVINEMYEKYKSVRYKAEMTEEIFDAFASAIAETFQGQTTKAIRIYNQSNVGEYTESYVLGQLNNLVPGLAMINYERAWINYWQTVVNIESVYLVVKSYDDYGTYTATNLQLYFFEEDAEPIINNDNSITFTGSAQTFYGYVFNHLDNNTINTNITGVHWVTGGTTEITSNRPIAIMRDTTVGGLALIDAGIKAILDTGDATIVTPYTGVNDNAISVPVPGVNMDKLVTDVKTGITSATQAIAESQAVVADKTDTQAMADAIAITASHVPKFETFDLSILFPFCLPFDLRDFLFMFVDTPKTPELDIKLPTTQRDANGQIVYAVYHVDLHDFDGMAEILRRMEVIAYCVALILITRSKMIRS